VSVKLFTLGFYDTLFIYYVFVDNRNTCVWSAAWRQTHARSRKKSYESSFL